MEYIEIACRYPDNFPGEEVLPVLLGEIGFESFIETEEGVSAYIPSDRFSENALNELFASLPEKIRYEKNIIPDQNWNAVWESNFEMVLIDENCIVRAPFHEKQGNFEFELIIEPRMAFGTAHHETTFQMLQLLLKEDVTGKTVLDMGCGTGIIAILAEKKGAASVTAIDNDEWAYNNTCDNLHINNTKVTKAFLGDASLLGDEHYDVIFANINRNILLQDMKNYCNVLNDNGVIFFSGFYTEDVETIQKEAEKYGLHLKTQSEKNNWSALKFQKVVSLQP
ncbi:MAG: 50S ribosomal protein L11 methyltransferase [Bacteroidales bacterium]|nr:50S ribosomal protein L11 methyltransferase [Bacteroidales bacterium]